MISITHVTKRFGRLRAVDDVSLHIAPGESVALWGVNGAGKTTLIRCVLGLLRFSGTIRVGGRDVRADGKRARLLIGYVPQELGLYDDLRAAEALAYFARLKGLAPAAARGALDRVGLGGQDRTRVRELSGGMKQRLALAIALLGDPPVLVLDEVTASLDAVGREGFVRMLADLRGEGRTMLFASHRVEEVGSLAGRVAVLERGRLAGITDSAAFVAGMAGGSVLHLMLSASLRDEAVRRLREHGFAARLNGIGVLVGVTPDRKAGPFRVLAEARITVDDFEVIASRNAANTTHTGGVS